VLGFTAQYVYQGSPGNAEDLLGKRQFFVQVAAVAPEFDEGKLYQFCCHIGIGGSLQEIEIQFLMKRVIHFLKSSYRT